MAIGFARMELVKAGSGSSAVGLSSYITRSARTDQVNGDGFNFSHKADELVSTGILLPEGSPDWAKDGATLWNRATEAELTVDRKTGATRFKVNAQIAKHFVLALPKELSDEERIALTQKFAREQFSERGVAVEWAIHRPDEDSTNDHAHLIVSTRRLEPKGFGKKARELNPGFATKDGRHFLSEQDHWEHKWTEFQNQFFRENGIDLEVDPFKLIPEETRGKARFVAEAEKGSQNADRKAAAAIAIREAGTLLEAATERAASFTRQDLKRILKVHGVVGAEADTAIEDALRSPELLELTTKDAGTRTGRYTTTAIRDQEERTLAAVSAIAGKAPVRIEPGLVIEVAERLTMDAEQTAVLWHATTRSFSIVQGDAGTGKSHTVRGIREVLERSGVRVYGAAPTNTVAADLRKDGFRWADTLHSTLGLLDRGDLVLDRRSALVVDEAAMTSSALLERLASHAASSGAALHIVGDDKQLASIARGGLYSVLRAEHGDAQLTNVRRQHADWMKQASRDFAAGRVEAAIDAYQDHGCIAWADTTADAREQLLDAWEATAPADQSARFIYASTNAAVDDLNRKAQARLIARGDIDSGVEFSTVRGEVSVAPGDRLQMHGNLKKAGIYNGTVGTVEQVRRDGTIALRFDDGRAVVIPAKFRDFGLGYAGTVYRGQGKTRQDVFALYDSPMGWNAQATYVAGTRHRASFKMFVSRDVATNRAGLIKQTSRSAFREASLVYDVAPVSRPQQQDNRNAKSARDHQFRKSTSAEPQPGRKSSAEPLAPGNQPPQPADRLRTLSSIRLDGGPRRSAVLLPDSSRLHMVERGADATDGLRRSDDGIEGQAEPIRRPETRPAAERDKLEQQLDKAYERLRDADRRGDWALSAELTYGEIPALARDLTALDPAAVELAEARHRAAIAETESGNADAATPEPTAAEGPPGEAIALDIELDAAIARQRQARQEGDADLVDQIERQEVRPRAERLAFLDPRAHRRHQLRREVVESRADAAVVGAYVTSARLTPNFSEGAFQLRQLAAALQDPEALTFEEERGSLEHSLVLADKAIRIADEQLRTLLSVASSDPAKNRQLLDAMPIEKVQAYQDEWPLGLVANLRGGNVFGREERRLALESAERVAAAAIELKQLQQVSAKAADELKAFSQKHVEEARRAAWRARVAVELKAKLLGPEAEVIMIAEELEAQATVEQLLEAQVPASYKVEQMVEIEARALGQEDGQVPD